MTETFAPKLTAQTDLEGVQRWRIVYHYRSGDSQGVHRAETIAWFHVTAQAAWVDAAALLPPAGHEQPHAVTVERGTYTAIPGGGYRWRHLDPTQHVQVDRPASGVPNTQHTLIAAAQPPHLC